MKITDTIKRAGRSLKNAKARTLLTSLAIGVGAFTITLALAAGEGGRQYAQNIVDSNTNVRELYVQPKQETGFDMSKPQEYTGDAEIDFGGGLSLKTLQAKDIDAMKNVDGVEKVTPIYNVSAKYITREGEKKYKAGVEAFYGTVKQEYVAGNGDSLGEGDAIIPDSFREVLGFATANDAIDQSIDVAIAASIPGMPDKIFKVKIVGVVKKSALAAMSGTGGLQASNDTVGAMYSYNQKGTPLENAYMGATVLVKDEDTVEAAKKSLVDKGYDAQTAEDALGFIFQFINVLQGILIGFGSLAVLTSVFGIINTQYISVLERTQQIGLMKALGMRRRDVSRLFKLEAAWIGFLGGALGSGTALAAGLALNPWITETLSLDGMSLLIFQPWTFVVVIAGLMLVAIASGILPARKASKLDPIEALRTE